MKNDLSAKQKELWKGIAKILWEEWDPIGVREMGSQWTDEYDGYVPSLFALLMDGRDLSRISNHLIELRAQNLGMPASDDNDIKIAERIMSMKEGLFGD